MGRKGGEREKWERLRLLFRINTLSIKLHTHIYIIEKFSKRSVEETIYQ